VATHNLPRGISIHYENGQFDGRLKSPADPCLAGTITLRKIKRGPNPVIGSDVAGRGGKWAVNESARHGRFYAQTGSFQTALGRCPAVRTRVLELG
jgi:hypothetical protein